MSIFGGFDPTALPRAIIDTFNHGWRRDKNPITETLHCVLGSNTWSFFVPVDSGWTVGEISQLLARHGITLFGAFRFKNELVFAVRIGQAAFAQWLLMREGVPLMHGLLADKSGRVAMPKIPEAANLSLGTAGEKSAKPNTDVEAMLDSVEQQVDAAISKLEGLFRF